MRKLFENWRKHLSENSVDREIEFEDEMEYQRIKDALRLDLQNIDMDWLYDASDPDMYASLDQLKRDSKSPDQFAFDIKNWLNTQNPAQIGYTNLGDDVLNGSTA